MYQSPDMLTPGVDPASQSQGLDPCKIQDHFEDFYQDLFEELSKHRHIESLNICDSLADHMVRLGFCSPGSGDESTTCGDVAELER
ncbi:unnamed protein product [Linum trigynum]|uniref:Uncharacterized protein n=1 Tax=Linum trigynum TaxID=586398 RepID=A0AAV2DAQ5_9ROSI